MIPRRFFWLNDLLIHCVSFLIAYALWPYLYDWLSLALSEARGLIQSPEFLVWLDAIGPFGTLPLSPEEFLLQMRELLWILFSMAPATIFFGELLGGYTTDLLRQSRARLVATSLFSPFAGLGLVLLILFALKVTDVSRLFIFSYTILSGTSLAVDRLVLYSYYNRRKASGYYVKNVALIGSPASIEWMMHYFSDYIPQTDYRLLGYLCLDPVEPRPSLDGVSLDLLGSVQDLGNLLIHHPISEVIVIQTVNGGDWLKQVITDCDYFRVALRIVPEALLFNTVHDLKVFYRNEMLRLPAVVLTPANFDSDALFVKRLFDIVISAALLVLLAPLFLSVMLAIKITTPRFPVFYPWRVVGRNGVEFTGYKFTTMILGADELKSELESQNEMRGPVFKIKNDPRITPLGRILRKFSINELPQLWSVLKGNMSLVGPRPAFRHELERYEFWQKRKLSIRPGITCLWQIGGRSQISDFDEWVRMDLEYIDNWSLWLDLKILLRTFWVVITGTGS